MEVQEKLKGQVLSREQMENLKKLGVDTSDASMVWINQDSTLLPDNIKELWLVDVYHDFLKPMVEQEGSDFVQTYTIGDLIEKLSNTIISDYEFKVTIKNHITESVFIENMVMEDYVKSHNPKNALYKTLCLVTQYYPKLLEVKK